MWNSPHSQSKGGKQYQLKQLSALLLPLDEMLYASKSSPVENLVDEDILRKLDRGELIYAIYQVFRALLKNNPVPEDGHTGIQEAIVAELLGRTHAQVCMELEDPDFGSFARQIAWSSVNQLLIKSDRLPWGLEEIGVDLKQPEPYLSDEMTQHAWELTLIEGGLWNEFLWDDDWRMDALMDLPPDKVESVTKLTGINLNTVQALPHTPTPAEQNMAEHFLYYLIWKDEVIHKREQ